MIDRPFDTSQDDGKIERLRKQKPVAEKVFVIFFTPRSGSSWLTDVCEKSLALSRPDECFNPNFTPEMTRALGARNLDEYIECLSRRRNTNGVFGCQLTYHQLIATFKNEPSFIKYFGGATYFWLTRKDIVSQAVSLAKMVETSISHAPSHSKEEIILSDKYFTYNRENIKHWLQHIRNAELATESFFSSYNIKANRIFYEKITEDGPNLTVKNIADTLSVEAYQIPEILSLHRKISTDKNMEYAARFYEEERDFVDEIIKDRSNLLLV